MRNVSHKKTWNTELVQLHVDPPPTPLIKSKHNDNPDNDFVKIGLRRDPTSENSNLYEFKIALFYNGYQEFFFNHNFKMTLKTSGTLKDTAKMQYLCTLFHGEALRQFDMLYADFEISTPLTLEDIFWY